MKLRMLFFVLVGAVILLACRLMTNPSSSTPSSTEATHSGTRPATGSTKGYQYVFEAQANPAELTLSLDQTRTAEATVPVEGGQIKATGVDGTVYTLEIPANALVSATKISLTPLASLSGLPFSSKVTYAVQLAPEGLILYKDAILTVAPPQPIALEKQVFFNYKGEGQGPGLAMPVTDSKEMKIRLFHFSGYGITEGEMSEVATVQEQLGSDPVSRLQSLAAQFLEEERIRQEGGTVEDSSLTGEALIDLINQYEEQVVKPALQAAESSCEAGHAAINSLIDLERTRQLLGVSSRGNLGTDLVDLMSSVAKVCVKEAYQQCVDEHIIHRMIPLWIGLMRENELLGGTSSDPEPEEVKLAEDLTVKCLTFELQFESRGSFDAGGGGGYKSEVKAKVRLQFNPQTITIKGEAPLDSISFDFTPPEGCTATSTPGGGTFATNSLEYITDTHSPDDEVGYVSDFRINFWPGVTTESFHVDCPPQGSSKQEAHYTSPPSGYWSGVFFALHAEELNAATGPGNSSEPGGPPPMPDIGSMLSGAEVGAVPALPVPEVSEGGGFVIDTWDVTGGELFATREWIKDDSSARITESGTFKLYHTPGG